MAGDGKIKLIAGLGNPGSKYSHTRHNAGILVLDRLAQKWDITIKSQSKILASGRGSIEANNLLERIDLVLLRPLSYMNLSGQAISQAVNYFKVSGQELLVVHDEIDLAYGDIRFKRHGGHRGHNGLRDIVGHIGAEFDRLRFGVGRPEHKDVVADYVLASFTKKEQEALAEYLESACVMCEEWLLGRY